MRLVIRYDGVDTGKSGLEAFVGNEAFQEIDSSSEKTQLLHDEKLPLGEFQEQALQALWALTGNETTPIWEAIEIIAKEAFLAGLAAERGQKLPILTAVK